MQYRDQFQEEAGDCLATCIECVLELPAGTLPRPVLNDFKDFQAWYIYAQRLYDHLEIFNLRCIPLKASSIEGDPFHPTGLSIGTYRLKDHPEQGHSCVFWYDKEIHNPSRVLRNCRDWQGELIDYTILVPINPAKPSGKFAIQDSPNDQPSELQ